MRDQARLTSVGAAPCRAPAARPTRERAAGRRERCAPGRRILAGRKLRCVPGAHWFRFRGPGWTGNSSDANANRGSGAPANALGEGLSDFGRDSAVLGDQLRGNAGQ